MTLVAISLFGENNLNASERLKKFLDDIDQYIEAKNFIGPAFNEEFKVAESFDSDKLKSLNQDDCFNYAYMLMQYADQINSELAKAKSVAAWCDDALNKMIASELMNMQQIAKHEMKVAAILKENEVAAKINEWKITAQSRIDLLQNKEYNIRRKADCLIEKGRRR